jgi:hypothetical protein
LRRTRQKELRPNQAKTAVKHAARATRFPLTWRAVYREYSRTSAAAPETAINRNTVPVTSSQSWWAARPKERSVVLTPLMTAFRVRLRPACCRATCAATPNFRKVETLLTALDFNSLWRYNDATLCCAEGRREPFSPRWHLKGCRFFELDEGGIVDPQLKQLMKELGDAINESLSDSEQISEVVSRIKEGGYDIFLVLEATIGVSKQGEKSPDKTSLVTTLSTNPEFKVSDQDLKFLKSLRIKIDEEKKDK